MKFYLVYKNHGLYDPVLDDTEPVFEPIDQDDFDQPSQPSEVFEPTQFIDLNDLLQSQPDILQNLSDSRSLTASPFPLPTKPYRPFSTEPIEVPPLEDPIILNPDYHDEFGKLDLKEFLPETRFKLPISEQYDPDGKRQKVTTKDERKEEKEVVTKEEVKFMEEMRREIDLENIEMTATKIVDESIHKAVEVAEEIKKEIDVALYESSLSTESKLIKESTKTTTDMIVGKKSLVQSDTRSSSDMIIKSKEAIEVSELVGLIDKTTEEIIQKNGTKSEGDFIEQTQKLESLNTTAVKERKLSTKQELEETIVTGNSKTKTSTFEREAEAKTIQKKDVKVQKTGESNIKDTTVEQRHIKQANKAQSSVKSESFDQTDTNQTATKAQSSLKGEMKTTSISNAKIAEQRAYSLGLKTIPSLRGSVHSSYHYNLLLQTFFLHLTDVMVALSRIILTQPVFNTEATKDVTENSAQTCQDDIISETKDVTTTIQKEVIEDTQAVTNKETAETELLEKEIQEIAVESTRRTQKQFIGRESTETSESLRVEELVEKRKLSGSKMAQLSDRKSEELTNKMDAVITEFQTKAGIEDTVVEIESVRSAAEEVIHRDEFKSTEASEKQETRVVTRSDKRHESKSSETHEGKTTYIAIVEAHVYTNKDAILDGELVDFSETTSIQSADETNIAFEANEAMSIEQVALENKLISEAIAEATEEPSKSVEIAEAKSVEILEQTKSKENVAEAVIEKKEVMKSGRICQVQKPIQKAVTVIKSNAVTDEKAIEKAVASKAEVKSEIIEEKQASTKKSLTVAEATEVIQEKTVAETTETAFMRDTHSTTIAKEAVSKLAGSIAQESKVSTIQTEEKRASLEEETAALKIVKEQAVGVSKASQASKSILKHTQQTHKVESNIQMQNSYKSEEVIQQEINFNGTVEQESSFVAKSKIVDKTSIQKDSLTAMSDMREMQKLTLKTDSLFKTPSQTSVGSDENNNTPSPTTVPPTPLTDEYMFRLEIPLPKSRGTSPVPRDCSPDSDEDPNIVKKKLIPHVETTVEEGVNFDPPLPTPPGSQPGSPIYTKPGLRGGGDRQYTKEEILEIERKSSLLTSAIDETIKSIEAYKEEVGIDQDSVSSGSENGCVVYSGYAKVIGTRVFEQQEKMAGGIVDTKQEINTEISEMEDEEILTESVNEIRRSLVKAETDVSNEVSLQKQSVSNENIITIDSVDATASAFEVETNKNAAEDVKSAVSSVTTENVIIEIQPKNPMELYRPVKFDVEEIQNVKRELKSTFLSNNHAQRSNESQERQMYKNETGELLGTHQGIVDGLEDAVVDNEVAKELGKPGYTEEKIAELISGESEMLREAHVMGLSRVLSSHMYRPDDSSVDFKKIKPIVESLRDSEVLKALNDEVMKTREEKKKEERKWTTFLQKPKRPVPTKVGYGGCLEAEEVQEPYKVKILKQPKPKVAPDYKPEDFNTGLLPWEERALREPSPPPVDAEEPILVPEDAPEILEAVDPLPESEVPDLEDSGIPLPAPEEIEDTPPAVEEADEEQEIDVEAVLEETEKIVEEKLVEEMDQSNIADQLMASVQNMIDPNASLDQQLAQMRAQLAALAQLPGVIQRSLEEVTRQLGQLTQLESAQQATQVEEKVEQQEEIGITQTQEIVEESSEVIHETAEEAVVEETQSIEKSSLSPEEVERMLCEEEEMLEEQRKIEKQKKELMEKARIEHESRQVKQRSTPRVGKPKPVFGPAAPLERPLVLPGGRKWRKPQDAYNEQFIAETLAAQAEIINGKAKGINFMKYEKPPVSLDHLQNSETYKMIHDMDSTPLKRVDMLTPVLAEEDYREKCRSMTPCPGRIQEAHLDFPQQVQP